jgi:hypothetical protein
MSKFQITLDPSFCNEWPLIRIEINNKCVWENHVESLQHLKLPFELQTINHIYISYLNKHQGPDRWDTVVDADGTITQDQYCIISNLYLLGSRCDFLLNQLAFQGNDGSEEYTLGFMSKKGHYHVEFPGDVYQWIVANRRKSLLGDERRSSSLDYWTNYLGDTQDAKIKELLDDIDHLLKQFT